MLLKPGLRLIAVWLVLSAAGTLFGPQILRPALPMLAWIAQALMPGHAARIDIQQQDGEAMLVLSLTTLREIPVALGVFIPPGKVIPASSHVLHNLVPAVILWSVLIAWPVRRLAERARLMLLGVAATLAILAATTPFVLAGLVETSFQDLADQLGTARAEPWFLTWMIFLESGGRWLLPLLAAALCIGAGKVARQDKPGELTLS